MSPILAQDFLHTDILTSLGCFLRQFYKHDKHIKNSLLLKTKVLTGQKINLSEGSKIEETLDLVPETVPLLKFYTLL